MKVERKHITPLVVATEAVRICTDTDDKVKGEPDINLLKRCIRKGHESVLEHIVYSFKLSEFSRAVLQELARHRIASLSVMSTRWALKKILKEDPEDILVMTGFPDIDRFNKETLRIIKEDLIDYPNDMLKYALPEAIETKCMLTINLRSFRNMVKLRTAPNALWEFQELVHLMIQTLPLDHRELIWVEVVDAKKNS